MSGRREFDTIEDALEAFNLPSDNLAVVREHLADRAYEPRCYIVASGQYIGLTPLGGGKIAYVNRGFIDFRGPDGVWQTITLPTNRIREGGYTQGKGQQRHSEACPACGEQMPLTRICDFC